MFKVAEIELEQEKDYIDRLIEKEANNGEFSTSSSRYRGRSTLVTIPIKQFYQYLIPG